MDLWWVDLIIYGFLLAILTALGTGLYSLLKPQKDKNRTAKALTVRIGLSLTLFLLLFLAFALGIIQPHGLNPVNPNATTSKPEQTTITKPHPQNANTKPQPQNQNGAQD